MKTLLDLYDEMAALGGREALLRSNAYRTWRWSYRELTEKAEAFAAELTRRGVAPGDRILLWSENRPEWAAAFWGALLRGVAVVPVDFRSSPDLVRSIHAEVRPALSLVGEELDPDALPAATRLAISDLAQFDRPSNFKPHSVSPEAIVEILYTSGSTSRPKGVVHRHRNLCSNLSSVAAEIRRHRWLARPFQPIRMLDLLPLSHLFGQTMGLFMPPMLGGSAAFTSDLGPAALLETVRRERISVLVGVPKMLDTLRTVIALDQPPGRPSRRGFGAVAETWWRHRDIHRRTGWKFWAFVTGGARLDEDLEDYWRNLGYAVIQGYGLTEASPVVSLNHPFSSKRGSLGKPLPGQQVRIAPDGEILVRGANVSEEYFGQVDDSAEGSTHFEGGWLHTGDLGRFDAQGRLYYRGRKRDLIVRSDGMNVHPQDIEAVLDADPAVAESVALGIPNSSGANVHAVIVPAGDDDAPDDDAVSAAIARANQRLEAHQRIQGFSIWRADELPRTASTQKIRRGELADRVIQRLAGTPSSGERNAVERLLDRDLDADASQVRLAEDLGMSSLDRVELLARVEQETGRRIDEESFSRIRTAAELERVLAGETLGAYHEPSSRESALLEPRWTRSFFARHGRQALLDGLILPLVQRLVEVDAEGLENLQSLDGPVIFVANHASHFDTATLYCALPPAYRRRIAPAMSQDYFAAWFRPETATPAARRRARAQYLLALGLFNAYPLPQQMAGVRRALEYSGELVEADCSLLVYPEGTRTTDGTLQPFRPGAALLAQRLEIPLLPVGLDGLFNIYSVHHKLPRKGRATVRFGRPFNVPHNSDPAEWARHAQQEVQSLLSGSQSESPPTPVRA